MSAHPASDLDLRRLRVLRELDERGTVTAVAEALHLTPSAVSQQLTALAKEVGVPLLEPAGRRVRLTGAARILLRHADGLFAQLEKVHADLSAYAAGRAGLIRLTSFGTAITGLVLPALRELRTSRPGLALEVSESDRPERLIALVHGDVDIALIIEAIDGPSPADERFDRVRLLADPMDVALPVGHRLAGKAEVRLTDLAEESWITGAVGACRQLTDTSCAAAGFIPDVVHQADEWATIFAMVEAGLGLALVPRLAHGRLTGDPSASGIVIRPLTGNRPNRHITALVRKGSAGAPDIAAVLEALDHVAAGHRAAPQLTRHLSVTA